MRTKIFLGAAIMGYGFFYLLCSWANWSWFPMEWPGWARTLAAIFGTVITCSIYKVAHEEIEQALKDRKKKQP